MAVISPRGHVADVTQLQSFEGLFVVFGTDVIFENIQSVWRRLISTGGLEEVIKLFVTLERLI